MSLNLTTSNQVYLSRDDIKVEITNYLKTYLELENVDLTTSSFVSYIIEVLSYLTSNLLFYQISTYKEFFLTKAMLEDSVYNLAAFLGYTISDATYSTCDLLVTIPFGFTDSSVTFTIDSGFEFKTSDDIKFITYYDTQITVTNNESAEVIITSGTKVYNRTVNIDTENNQFSFVLPTRQIEAVTQEFQIDADLDTYQFFTLEVPLDGKVSSIVVSVTPPNSSASTTYTSYASIFLMDESTYGYVSRNTEDGKKLSFGNGIMGIQPEPGSTVTVVSEITEGADGNVIAGSVINGERIYNTTDAGTTEVVNYSVTNILPASGGTDEESLETIRQNAIDGLVSLNRLVGEEDFKNISTVISDSPINTGSLPVLKRSDVSGNDIQLFTTLTFSDLVVPMLNTSIISDTTVSDIPRLTEVTKDSVDYYTIFDMNLDHINNSVNYYYIMYEIEKTPTLVTSFGSEYDILATNFTVEKVSNTGNFYLYYISEETDYDTLACEMEVQSTGAKYSMTNFSDSTSLYFEYTFSNYLDILVDENTYYFTISHPSTGTIAKYSVEFIFRKSLKDFSMSDIVDSDDSTACIIYDVPVIKKDYYDGISKKAFELQILQNLMTNVSFKNYKMLTDFINLKFSNTTGSLDNMQLNSVSKQAVTELQGTPPVAPSEGDRYIVINGTGAWEDHDNDIAQCIDSTSITWSFVTPTSDDMVLVSDRSKKYIYADNNWVLPSYEIPFTIKLEVFKENTYTDTSTELISTIKAELLSTFSSRFGINSNIYRSEIIRAVQGVNGVNHCRLLQPKSNIFFDFDLDDLTESELLNYSPQYVYFDEDSISITVI